MAMRFRGGGVGHTSTQAATDTFLSDRDCLDLGAASDRHESHDELGNEFDDFDDEYIQAANKGEDEPVMEDEQEDWSDIYGNEDGLEDGSESEENPDEDERELADDALGPDDGEVDDDAVAGLGFAAF